MLRRLALGKVYHILDVADRSREMLYAGIRFDSPEWSDAAGTASLQTASSCMTSCDSEELPAALNALTHEEKAELAALFYSGRDRAEFFAVMQSGRKVADHHFGAYLGGKHRFAEYVRAGLKRLGHSTAE